MVTTRRQAISVDSQDAAPADDNSAVTSRRTTRSSRFVPPEEPSDALPTVREASDDPQVEGGTGDLTTVGVKNADKSLVDNTKNASIVEINQDDVVVEEDTPEATAQLEPELSEEDATETTEAVAGTSQEAMYTDLLDSIMSGFGASEASEDSDEMDEDTDEDDSEGEGMDAAGDEIIPWNPEVQAPDAADAHGTHFGKPSGLSKLTVAPSQDSRVARREAAKHKSDTTGGGWFDMKAREITPQVKQDWRLLRLRAAMDPRHFYKKFDSTKIPKYFEMGEVVEGAGEFYSSRMNKKDRKQSLTEELLADIKLKRERNKRYGKLQEETQKWAKKRKKNQPKVKRSAHRPKH